MKSIVRILPHQHLLMMIVFMVISFNEKLIAGSFTQSLDSQKSIIENKGQFSLKSSDGSPIEVLFAYDGDREDYFFTKKGVIIQFTKKEKRIKSDAEKAYRKQRKIKGFKTKQEWQEFEQEGNKLHIVQDELTCYWLNASADVELIPESKNNWYHSYTINKQNKGTENINYIPSYKKLVYKNIYKHVDLVYEFHAQGGLKYSLILHPGFILSDIQLHYSKDIQLLENGTIITSSLFGSIKDHQPITFYTSNEKQLIESSYEVSHNTIGFKLGQFDSSKVITIDPWTQTPTFNTNWDCVWECERDGLGNVYIIGGVMPLQLLKYNASGALQWTYNTPYDTTAWMGTFATDLLGNSYITNGTYAAIQKLDNAANLAWNNPNPGGLFSSTELWTIAFNCDQTKLIVGGTGGGLVPQPYIYDINLNTGNVTASVQTNLSNGLFDIEEVRSITACKNGKYYFLTHDSIGYIHQSLNTCSSSAFPFHVSNEYALGYKCENWRYDNSGIAAIKYYNDFIYTLRGNQLDKRDFNTAAIIMSVPVPGGVFNNVFLGGNQLGNAGIDIDDCGNIFVGSSNGVYKFDQNLNPLGSFPTLFNVYDVVVSTNGDVIACGSTGNSGSNNRTGFVQSFAASACVPQASICCDASICDVPSFCAGDAPFQLLPSTSGGTWSGTGVNSSGYFDPSASGVGVFTLVYSLSCDVESITVYVNSCTALSVCEELNGSYTVSGGSGPYTWSFFNPASSTPITNQAECTSCGYSWFFGTCLNGIVPVTTCNTPAQWVTYATGINAPAPNFFPAQVQDNSGTIFTITGPGTLPLCSPCPPITASSGNISNPDCFGGTGSATLMISGGSGPYNYNWLPGNLTGASQSNLLPGIYDVFITDINGCTGTTTVTITAPPQLQTNNSGVIPSSCGNSNGASYVSAIGGTGSYQFTWSNSAGTIQITNNNSTSDTVFNLTAGDYFIIVSDSNNCTVSDTLTVYSSAAPVATLVSSANASCGINNGTIVVAVSGGSGTYTFDWFGATGLLQSNNNIIVQDSLINIAAGNYIVIVTDSNSCSDSLFVSVNNINAAALNLVSQTNLLCFGDDTASAVVIASGGIGPYIFNWFHNGTLIQSDSLVLNGDTLNNAIAGQYQLEVKDSAGCISNISVTISGPNSALVIASLQITDASCGNNDGSASITVSGGTSGYSYSWQPGGATTSSVTNLAVGTYLISVTDANSCTLDTTISIANSNGPILTITNVSNTSCYGWTDGTVSVSAMGGTGNITYQWTSNLGNSNTIVNLPAGVYTVTATDSLGCSANATVTISDPPLITAVLVTNDAYCNLNNGSAQVAASGGTGTLSYLWNNGLNTTAVSNLPQGICNVTITDSLGCMQVFSGIIQSIGGFTIDAGLDVTIDAGNSVELQGNGPASGVYQWSPMEFLSCSTCDTTIATPPVTTVYVLSVNYNGCIATDTVLVEVEEKCGDVFVPSGFSPNGDNINDILFAHGTCIVTLDFRVYDRWGELVFQSSDKNVGWDGTYKGKQAMAGVYVYYLYADLKGTSISTHGNITLLRE